MYSRLCSFVFIYCQNLRIFWFRLTIYVNTTSLVMSTRDYLTDFYKKICLKMRFSQWFKMTYVWIQLYYTRFEEEEVYSPSILPSETNIFVIFSSIIKDDSHLIFWCSTLDRQSILHLPISYLYNPYLLLTFLFQFLILSSIKKMVLSFRVSGGIYQWALANSYIVFNVFTKQISYLLIFFRGTKR